MHGVEHAQLPVVCCRHSGPLKADLLQQFVADRLLDVPPAPAVDPDTIDRFLARVPHHKVAVLAFSTAIKASIPLRHAAEQHKGHVVVGRVQWKPEVLGLLPLGGVQDSMTSPCCPMQTVHCVFWHIYVYGMQGWH